MPTICTVTGQISDIFAGALGELKVEFSSAKTNAYKSGDDVISVKNLRTKTDTNGILTVDLVPGEYTMRLITSSRRVDETHIVVPEVATASLANLIVSPIPENVDAAVQAVLNAQSARDEANAARDAASVSETNAATSAANASTSASDSESAKIAAQAARTGAEAAQSGSQSAQISAETARDESQIFASQSQASATNANTAQIAAETAKTASESALTSVNAAKVLAETAQTNAEIAASNANTSESNAFTSATIASSAADTTTAARDQALVYRDTAENHKNVAEAASASAQSAVAYLNLSGAEETLTVNAVAVWSGVLPPMPLSEQVTKSWYNESASATRGSRRDLPTSVLVVGEASSVTIYDLDSGVPEMWMVFTRSSTSYFASASQTVTSVRFIGHNLVFGTSSSGLRVVSFLEDAGYTSRSTTGFRLSNPTSGRNSGNTFPDDDALPVIANSIVNAIATYTAPNAPLNEAGQPISVVPVGTAGGLSVILEDDTINDSASTISVVDVLAHDQGVHWITASGLFFATWEDIRAGDGFGDQIGSTTAGAQAIDLLVVPEKIEGGSGQIRLFGQTASGTAVAGVMGLLPNYQNAASSLSKMQTPDFATPVQFGRPALTALCEADDTDLVAATPLNDNGSSTTGWTLNAGWSHDAVNSELDHAPGNTATLERSVTGLVDDAYYALQVGITNRTAGSVTIALEGQSNAGVTADNTLYFQADGTTGTLVITPTSDFDGSISTALISLTTPDRSVNGRGLIINTGLDVNPVFPGAKTMAYSGFSASKYLEQPYNPDLDFGTGDFFISGWVRFSALSGGYIFDRSDSDLTNRIAFRWASTGKFFYFTPSAGSVEVSGDFGVNVWHSFAICRKSGLTEIFVGGASRNAFADTENLTGDGTATLLLGIRQGFAEALTTGSLSLLTISAGAPTPEQIRVKYLAERPRFYGGAVDPTLPETALDMSFDPVTGLLWMIGATKVWAMDGDGYLAGSTLANKGTAAHNRIDVHEGEVSTWEDAV